MDIEDTNGVNATEDTEMAECDGEKVVTMMDVLQEQQDFEDDANAVLGASDDKECTYSLGYIKRQALYACLTCCSEAKVDPSKRAGVCLACSLNCHEQHELVELYTKRNFRCDCGNPKFNSNPCQFTPNKTELNEDNSYNQNFSGLYCSCNRPYPDPESTNEDEMIQCSVCEDWFHSAHLDAKLPASDLYAEMICKGCMEKNEFLHDYSDLAVNVLEDVEVDVDDSKDSNVNGEAEVKANEVSESEKNTDSPVIEAQTEKNLVNQDKEKPDNTDEMDKDKLGEELALRSTEIAPDTEKSDRIETESAAEASTKADEALSAPEKVDETPVLPETKENVPSESVTVNDTNNSEKTETTDNTSSEDKPQESEKPPTEPEEKLTVQPTAGETSNETVENELEDQPNKETAQDETLKDDVTKMDESVSGDSAAPANDKEVTNSATNDDNKEIDAIDKLLAEGTTEEEPKSESKPEDVETNEHTAEQMTSDTNNKTEEPEQIADTNKEEATTNENPEVKPSDDDIPPTTDIEMNEDTSNKTTEPLTNGSSEGKEHKRKLSTEDAEVSHDVSKKPKLDDSVCVRPKSTKKKYRGATFWPPHFRQRLCTCSECITMYKDLSVLFLTDLEDTVTAYEDLGKAKTNGTPATQYEKGLEALSSLDRIQQINALTEYNRMRDKLLDFLKSFKDRKEVVKEEDIKAFFADMKPKREPDGVYFCR